MKKADGIKDMEKLLDRLLEKAKMWEAERDSLSENDFSIQEIRDEQDASGEDEDS